MTNSPTYNKQLALSEYWKSIGGLSFLPGTNRAADRFARASFYINALPETDDERIAVASVFSVVRNASVPYGISTPESPEISTTQWRTVSESKNLRYFFESSLTPNTFWVNLKDFDLSEGLRCSNCLLPMERCIMEIQPRILKQRCLSNLWA